MLFNHSTKSRSHILVIYYSLILLFLLYTLASAHSGRTNEQDCHLDNQIGTEHCHQSNDETNSKDLRIIDADTIWLNGDKIRFSGIDAPELKQNCRKDEQSIECGKLAKQQLELFINNKEIKCLVEGKDFFGRLLGECFLKNYSLSKFLVRNGYAFAYVKYSKKFIDDEIYAKENKLGLWVMDFEYPWDYRKKN